MQGTKFQYRSCLIAGLVITFLFVGKTTYIYAQGEYPAALSSIQHELKEIKSLPPLRLGFELVGTIIAGKENSFAFIMDETTGKQGMYRLGESINGATVLKIDKEGIIVEKDGKTHILRITGGNNTEAVTSEVLTVDGPPVIGVAEVLPYFEPVFSETGPPGDENVNIKELPRFEPITNSTGPQVDNGGFHNDLPEFHPSINHMSPPE